MSRHRHLLSSCNIRNKMETEEIIQRNRAWEHGLPAYLQHDLDAMKS